MKQVIIACAVVLLALNVRAQAAAQNLNQLLAAAKPGQTVELPAGEFSGGATVPAGVSVKGAGVGKTIIDAKGSANGLTVAGGRGATISDLTIRGAQGAGMSASKAESLTLARVRVAGNSNGIQLHNVKQGRVENCISDHNSFGITVNGGSDCVIVNCTLSDCAEIGISLAASPNAVVFNNCVAGSAICLNIDKPSNVKSDHNLFFGLFVGQTSDQIPKKLLSGWQNVTTEAGKPALDVHSVQIPVTFKDSAAGDFAPATLLPWSLDRAATSDWAAAEFAGVKAPPADIAGKPRVGRFDVGAVESPAPPARTADGELTISRDEGVKSAGVFTRDGMLVSYLFQNLPLPKGKYPFWLPVRDYAGRPIPAGNYEVRVAESDFRWKFICYVGDTGGPQFGADGASNNPKAVAFAGDDTLVMQGGESEDHTDLRAFDTVTGKLRWSVYGLAEAQGVAYSNGTVYYLRGNNVGTGESRLTRVNATTGAILPWPGSEKGHEFPITGPKSFSMAALGDRLYVANAAGNKLVVLKTADGKVEKSLDVASPKCVAADEKNNLLWVVSNGALVALDASGKKVAESKAVADPAAVAVGGGKLAVASQATGKVHLFDAANPADLKPIRTVGTGDGPYGAFDPARFYFRKAPAWGARASDLNVNIALNSKGHLGLTDADIRVSMFDEAGKTLWHTYGVSGNYSRPSFATKNRRLWDPALNTSLWLDEKAGSWKVEALWDFSALSEKGLKDGRSQLKGDFGVNDKAYLVSVYWVDASKPNLAPVLLVARLDEATHKAVPVFAISDQGGQLVARKDTNNDGKITDADTAERVLDAQGKPVTPPFSRFNDLQPDGSITVMGKPGVIWKPTIDANGIPTYEGKNLVALPSKDWTKDISPYDFKPDPVGGLVQIGFLADGGYVGQTIMRSSGGAGLNNGAGTDLCGYGPDGRLRWVNQMAAYKGIAGMGTIDDITITTIYYTMDVLAVDADGLGLGAFGEAPELHYGGYWIDHPNMRLFKMADGKLYMTNGDNADGRHNWYRLDNQESLVKTKHPFTLAQPRAGELAAIEFKQLPPPVCPQPEIKVARLSAPMPIDGDVAKWQKAGVKPQIVMGPGGKMEGAGDCSALIRVAYEGNNLYVQVLSFDDVPVFGNFPVHQNAVEMAVNGVFPSGMQFVAARNNDNTNVVWRNRFFDNNVKQLFLPSNHAPCVVKVLDDAKSVPERETLEALYGQDLSQAKVVVTEFKVPLDKVTYQGAEKDIPELGPGKTFWINFFVDDSDTPHNDTQELIAWPVGSGMFGNKEEGAIATCE